MFRDDGGRRQMPRGGGAALPNPSLSSPPVTPSSSSSSTSRLRSSSPTDSEFDSVLSGSTVVDTGNHHRTAAAAAAAAAASSNGSGSSSTRDTAAVPPIGVGVWRGRRQELHGRVQAAGRRGASSGTLSSSPRTAEEAAAAAAATGGIHPSILQPRVAVVLNVPPIWHPWLFALRLLSCLPSVWWGLPSALHLLLRFLPGPDHNAFSSLYQGNDGWSEPYALMETALATIWCFACGYLSFFFTDCLMSRWLINYTPQATIVRLLTIDTINAYITLTTLSLCGGFQDPRLLLPGWIGIATTLTVCYHISHQRINIRKETSTSINVFSIASYLSMVALLAHMLAFQPDYPTMPVVERGRGLWQDALLRISQIKGTIERERAEL